MTGRPAVSVVVGVVVGLAGVSFITSQPWSGGVLSLAVFVAAGLLELFHVPVRDDAMTSLSPVAVLLGLLIGGVPVAVAAALGAGLVMAMSVESGPRLLKAAYNVVMFVLSGYVAAVVFVAVAGENVGPPAIDVGPWLVALALASVSYQLTNVVLLTVVIWATGGPSPGVTVPALLAAGWWGQLATIGLSLAAFVVYVEAGPWALMLLLVPIVSARRALAGLEAQRSSLDNAVRSLVRLVEVKDEYTRGHAERVAELSDRVAERMGMSATDRYWIRIGAVLHDVGKIGVPLEVLNKPGPLDDEEYWQMRRHPDVGADLLDQVDALEPAVHLIRQHHERLDGCGYPRGLSAEDLPLGTRIVSAVDSWDAMTTTRPYRAGLPVEVAIAELRAHSGTQFDADVVANLIAEVAPDLVAAPAPVSRRRPVVHSASS